MKEEIEMEVMICLKSYISKAVMEEESKYARS